MPAVTGSSVLLKDSEGFRRRCSTCGEFETRPRVLRHEDDASPCVLALPSAVVAIPASLGPVVDRPCVHQRTVPIFQPSTWVSFLLKGQPAKRDDSKDKTSARRALRDPMQHCRFVGRSVSRLSRQRQLDLEWVFHRRSSQLRVFGTAAFCSIQAAAIPPRPLRMETNGANGAASGSGAIALLLRVERFRPVLPEHES